MFESIPLALASIKSAKDIATTLIELRDFSKIASATIELKSHLVQTYDHIIAGKEQVLTIQEKISELEKECARLKDWSAEKKKYTRRQIASGVFAYIENSYKGPFENAHKLCCNCFDKTIQSTLQQSVDVKSGIGRFLVLACSNGCPRIEIHDYLS